VLVSQAYAGAVTGVKCIRQFEREPGKVCETYLRRFNHQIDPVSTVANATHPTRGTPARAAVLSTRFAALMNIALVPTMLAAAIVEAAN
jgi:hypothetical protein